MADDQIIGASIQLDSDEALKNVLRLKGEVKELDKELKGTASGSDAQVAAFKKLAAKQDELANATKSLGGNFSKLKGELTSMPASYRPTSTTTRNTTAVSA